MVRLLSALKLVSSVIAVIVDVVEAVDSLSLSSFMPSIQAREESVLFSFLFRVLCTSLTLFLPSGRIVLRCVLMACTPTLDIEGVDVSFEGKDNVTKSPLSFEFLILGFKLGTGTVTSFGRSSFYFVVIFRSAFCFVCVAVIASP